MCLAAASGGITQTIVSGLVQMYKRHENFNTNEIANAVLASLVAITGCCPFIEPAWALLIGCKICSANVCLSYPPFPPFHFKLGVGVEDFSFSPLVL